MRNNDIYSEAELKTLLENVTDLVIVGNADGIYRCNKLALKFFKAKTAQDLTSVLPSLSGFKIIKEGNTNQILKFEDLPFNKALSGENYKMDIVFTHIGEGKDSYFHCHGVPISHDGKIVAAVLILTDYTYEKEAKDAIENAINEVEEIKALNKRLEKYSAAIAHDLNSPLNNIQGLSHILIEEYGETMDPKAVSFLELIYKSSFKLSEYVISLLKLSSINTETLEKELVLLDPIIEDIMEIMDQEYKSLSFNFSYDKGIKVFADKNLLFGVLQNLIINSIKFSSENPDPKFHIGAETNENNKQIIYINDNGLGFSDKDAENIFIPKFRTELSAKYPGRGIGLATVQQIINSHGGRIWAKGIPGQGATFYIYFPEE